MRIGFGVFHRFVTIKGRLNTVKHHLTRHNPASGDILLARGKVGLDVFKGREA